MIYNPQQPQQPSQPLQSYSNGVPEYNQPQQYPLSPQPQQQINPPANNYFPGSVLRPLQGYSLPISQPQQHFFQVQPQYQPQAPVNGVGHSSISYVNPLEQPQNLRPRPQQPLQPQSQAGSNIYAPELRPISSPDIVRELDKLYEEEKVVTMEMFKPILKDTYWDSVSFGYIKERFKIIDPDDPYGKKESEPCIARVIVSLFTRKFLPRYGDIHFTSDASLKESEFYKHPEEFVVYQPDSEPGVNGIPRAITPPTHPIGRSRKYVRYDTFDYDLTPHIYPKTIVKIFNGDTLAVAKSLRSEGETNVCVLSMTHSKKPGGGWLRGFGGQEVEMFMRTTLPCGIDRSFYPMKDYDSVFVKDVVVIREGEDKNYVFLPPEERYTVDVISMCSLDLSGIKRKEMTPEQIDVVRLKVRSMFIVCIQNGVKNLVLGALGCGLFKNDPAVVAKVFEAELTAFAGFFNKVYFAVLDEGTAQIFRNVLGGECKEEREYVPRIDWFRECVGPTLGSVTERCEKGSTCTDTSPEHLRSMDHLPLCFDPECKSTDDVHRACFRHKVECPLGVLCTKFENEKHTRYFEHKKHKVCPDKERCTNIAPEHLSKFMHYPVCEHGKECKISDERHRRMFRHVDICPEGTMCKKFLDEEHLRKCYHTFRTPCPDDLSGWRCKSKGDKHFEEYSHICFGGPNCPKINDPEHCQHYIHVRPEP